MQTSITPQRQSKHPLIAAGLIPEEMAEILEIPRHNAAGIKKRTKCITGARDLTAEDYREMLVEDKRRKEDLAEHKRKRMEERKRKKLEKEKKTEVTKCKGKKVKGKGKQKQVQQCPSEIL